MKIGRKRFNGFGESSPYGGAKRYKIIYKNGQKQIVEMHTYSASLGHVVISEKLKRNTNLLINIAVKPVNPALLQNDAKILGPE